MDRAAMSNWSHAHPHDSIMSTSVEDFTSFLDLGDFAINFPSLESIPGAAQGGAPADLNAMMDGRMDGSSVAEAQMEALAQAQRQQLQQQQDALRMHQQQQQQSSLQTMAHVQQPIAESPMALNLQTQFLRGQQQQQQQQQRQQQRRARMERQQRIRGQGLARQWVLPPTPNSSEMQSGALRYYPSSVDAQAQQAVAYQRTQDDQMMFTPLVSPAVTPLEAQFAVPEYTVPGAYLSPLTSPALEAQYSASHGGVYHQASRSETSMASSPVDLLDHSTSTTSTTPVTPTTAASTAVTSQPASAKKPRRASVSTRTPARVVRQSPLMKPQRRKVTLNTVIPTQELIELARESRTLPDDATPSSADAHTLPLPRQHGNSESDSISPEPLTEALMPPPPAPDSATGVDTPPPRIEGDLAASSSSGASEAPPDGVNGNAAEMHPATPASLMRLPKGAAKPRRERAPPLIQSHITSGGHTNQEETAAAAAAIQGPSELGSSAIGDNAADVESQTSPTSSTLKTPIPRSVQTPTAGQSPSSSGPTQSQGKTGEAGPEKKKGNVGRGGKKRTSSNSIQVSPALRPKISPSIKPLLPDGATVSAEASALLLASKSNYQNILEGNHLPGVSYPEALSTNLTSKRTSHKIAEQGRRNRINQALQEIASLLPANFGREKSGSGAESAGGSGNGNGGGGSGGLHGPQQSSSKASTVEMAIAYIKELQRDLSETKEQLEVAERKLGGMSDQPG